MAVVVDGGISMGDGVGWASRVGSDTNMKVGPRGMVSNVVVVFNTRLCDSPRKSSQPSLYNTMLEYNQEIKGTIPITLPAYPRAGAFPLASSPAS